MATARTRNLRLALTEEELQMAHALAEAEDLSVVALLRRYIRKAYAKKFGGAEKGKR